MELSSSLRPLRLCGDRVAAIFPDQSIPR
jgi:hypothetical protein